MKVSDIMSPEENKYLNTDEISFIYKNMDFKGIERNKH